MQKRIEELADGIFSYDVPKLTFDEDIIKVFLGKDQIIKGNFTIRSVDNRRSEGYVYSSNHRMNCVTNKFSGSEAVISYEYNSYGLSEGTQLNGNFCIISDAGEYEIPFEISVVNTHIESNTEASANSTGTDQFISLAKNDWYSAFDLFKSDRFSSLLNNADNNLISVYNALCSNGKTMHAMEEFLIYLGGKEAVDFELTSFKEEFYNVKETVKHSIAIKKNTWGYIELLAESNCRFIKFEKDFYTTEDFIGSSCNIEYFIDSSCLHDGMNIGRIIIYSPYDSQEFMVTAYKEKGVLVSPLSKSELNKCIMNSYTLYKDFRTGVMGPNSWAKESVLLFTRMLNLTENNGIYILLKAMALVISKQKQETDWLLEKYSRENLEYATKEEKGLYLYIQSLSDDSNYLQKEELINFCYKHNESWVLNWILIHSDEKIQNNSADRYRIIKKSILRGCYSPIMLLEAYNTLKENPFLLNITDETDVYILQWLYKNNFLTKEIGSQFLEQLIRLKRFYPKMYKLADFICTAYENETNVSMLCGYLIRNEKIDLDFNKWYKKGIEYDLKITRLYEYFLLSCDDEHMAPLPKIIYMYFRYNSNIDNRKKAFLYANVISNKNLYPEMFKSYQKNIEQFMIDQFFKGVINDNTAIIYNEFFYGQLMMDDKEEHFVDIFSCAKLVVMEGMINKVTIIYKNLNIENTYNIVGGKAYINLFSDEYTLVFSDGEKNYASNIHYAILPLFHGEDFVKKAFRIYKNNAKLLIYYTENKESIRLRDEERFTIYYGMINSDIVNPVYKQTLINSLIREYYDLQTDIMIEELLKIPVNLIDSDIKSCYAEILLQNGYYENVYKIIKTTGYESISNIGLIKLATYMIAEEDFFENDFLTALCFDVFSEGKYNDSIMKYLVKYYKGSTNKMNLLRKASDKYGIDAFDLYERIVRQILYTGTYFGDSEEVFNKYCRSGASLILKNAFIQYHAYEYLIHKRFVSDNIFELICQDALNNDRQKDICKLAFLQYWSEKDYIQPKVKGVIAKFLEEFYFRGISLKCFKKLALMTGCEYGQTNNTLVEYVTNPNHKVEIHYIFDSDDYIDEEMKKIFDGIFVKEFTMFFGEDIQYYITESFNDSEQVVESGNIKRTDASVDTSMNRFDMINDVLLSVSLNDDITSIDLIKQYEYYNCCTNNLFKTL